MTAPTTATFIATKEGSADHGRGAVPIIQEVAQQPAPAWALEIAGKAHAILELLSESADTEVEAVIDEHFVELVEVTSTARACSLLGKARATHYRRQRPPVLGPLPQRPSPPNRLSEPERQRILTLLRSPEYCDLAPGPVVGPACSTTASTCAPISTMYRRLAIVGENRERRRQRTHPAKKRPELIARRPNQVWSWDILVYDPAFLVVAWSRVRANEGSRSAGVDGVVPFSILFGAGEFLTALRDDLKARRFTPSTGAGEDDPQGEREAPSPRHPDRHRPGRAGCVEAGARAGG